MAIQSTRPLLDGLPESQIPRNDRDMLAVMAALSAIQNEMSKLSARIVTLESVTRNAPEITNVTQTVTQTVTRSANAERQKRYRESKKNGKANS